MIAGKSPSCGFNINIPPSNETIFELIVGETLTSPTIITKPNNRIMDRIAIEIKTIAVILESLFTFSLKGFQYFLRYAHGRKSAVVHQVLHGDLAR